MSPTRIPPLLILVAAGLLAIIVGAPSGLCADLQRFVDFDGDGFNDNTTDLDFDGIPDELEFHGFLSSQSSLNLGVNQMFSGSDTLPSPSESKPCAADFGSGLGLSGGLGGGGACAGGICF